MDDNSDPTSVIKMINDLKSSSMNYRRSSGVSLRISGTGVPMTLMEKSNDDDNDDDANNHTPTKRKRLDDNNSSSLMSRTCNDVAGSPWEWRRMRGELVSLRTRLSHQEANVQQLHKIRRQMEEVFDKEKSIMEKQAELDKQTIKQLEARIDVARRNSQESRESRAKIDEEFSRIRARLEEKIVGLTSDNARLVETHRRATTAAEQTTKLKEEKSLLTENPEIVELREKLELTETRIRELEEKLRVSRDSQSDAELTKVELQNARIKIENLESERSLWQEGKLLSSRAARASDLEKELTFARETIAAMRETVKGKLLLEEEMCDMRKRIQHMDKIEERCANIETEKIELQRKLGRYESIGFDGDAIALRRELQRLQHAEAVLIAEEGQLRSKSDTLLREISGITKKYEEAKKLAMEMTSSTERLNILVGRLQKKMILVTRERDSYRQQLDLYEKEITSGDNCSNVMNDRIPALERALDGYRDLVSKLEADLGVTETGVGKDECTKLREEIERLKGELEHRALKGDFNCNAKILHLTMNPSAIAGQLADEKQQALIREVEELRARVQVGAGSSVVGVSSLHAQEIAELKQTHDTKISRLKDAFRLSSQEYRQACYQLFGWRVDRTKEGEYKLFSQYAESPDDFLFFHVGDEGVDLLETNFSSTLSALIERHLEMQHSVPMFINAVQCDLFAQQTVTNIV